FGGALGLYLGGKSIAATGSFRLTFTMISLACVAGLILSFVLKPRKETAALEKGTVAADRLVT
ncbi:MAG: hypothetical protein ABSC19_15310, partial [Syntrophorhabdales bacterium]